MRVALTAALLLAVSLAGCSSGGGDASDPDPGTSNPDPGDNEPDPTPRDPITELVLLTDFHLISCDGMIIVQPTDAAAVQALLPAGFTVATDALPTGQAIVFAEMYRCDEFRAVEALFEEVWFGRTSTLIEPVTEEHGVAATEQAYTFEMLAGEDILAAVWPVAGYPTINGTVDLVVATPGTSHLITIGAEVELETIGEAAPSAATDVDFAWYHQTESGDTLVWTGDAVFGTGLNGLGRTALPPASALDGLGTVPGTDPFGQGTWSFDNDFTDMHLVKHLAEPI